MWFTNRPSSIMCMAFDSFDQLHGNHRRHLPYQLAGVQSRSPRTRFLHCIGQPSNDVQSICSKSIINTRTHCHGSGPRKKEHAHFEQTCNDI